MSRMHLLTSYPFNNTWASSWGLPIAFRARLLWQPFSLLVLVVNERKLHSTLFTPQEFIFRKYFSILRKMLLTESLSEPLQQKHLFSAAFSAQDWSTAVKCVSSPIHGKFVVKVEFILFTIQFKPRCSHLSKQCRR